MIDRLTLSASLPELMEALETLLVYTRLLTLLVSLVCHNHNDVAARCSVAGDDRNLIQFPDEKKYRKVKTSNQHYLERLGHLPGIASLPFGVLFPTLDISSIVYVCMYVWNGLMDK
jgi:hypothetical protein